MRTKILLAIVILVSALVILPTTMLSGSEYCFGGICGTYFWGAHEHDGIWHLAVIESIKNGMGGEMPTFAGHPLSGYNTLIDWVIAVKSRLSTISPAFMYFKVIPVVWFVVMVLLLYRFARTYRPKGYFAPPLLLFSFLGSSFSFLIPLLRRGVIEGSSSLLSMQSSLALLNPQLALSLLCLVGYLILTTQKNKNYTTYLLYGLLSAIALGLKFYTGVIILVMMGVELLIHLRRERLMLTLIKRGLLVLIPSLVVTLLVYNPGSGESPFIWRPFATINPIIEQRDLIHIPQLAIKLYTEQGVTLLAIELLILVIFLVMNLGSRVVGIAQSLMIRDGKFQTTTIVIWAGAIVGTLLSILLVQRGIWWNTVQFLHVALFLWGIIAADGVDQALRSGKKLHIVLATIAILLVIPQNVDVVKSYLRTPGDSYISVAEMEALAHLRMLEAGVVYVAAFEKSTEVRSGVAPLPEVYDTAYITAYSGKQVYLADRTQLELLSIPYLDRLKRIQEFDCTVLGEVDYLYERYNQPYVYQFAGCDKEIDTLLNNQEVTIYLVK